MAQHDAISLGSLGQALRVPFRVLPLVKLTPRTHLVTLPAFLVPLFLVALMAACSSNGVRPEEALLDPGDFPGIPVTASNVQAIETVHGQSAAQIEIEGLDFVLIQSVVVFESALTARTILGGIKVDRPAQDAAPFDARKFQDVSGVLTEIRGGQESLTLVFVEGRALVRITISGPDRRELLPLFAEKARLKVSRR